LVRSFAILNFPAPLALYPGLPQAADCSAQSDKLLKQLPTASKTVSSTPHHPCEVIECSMRAMIQSKSIDSYFLPAEDSQDQSIKNQLLEKHVVKRGTKEHSLARRSNRIATFLKFLNLTH
jgi:hypothetical protein